MKKRITMNEEMFDLNGDKGIEQEVNKEVQAVVTPTYKKAIKDHEEIKKNIKKDFKDQEKIEQEFLKQNHNRHKNKLEESLFEDVDDEEDEFYYRQKRGSLGDVIYSKLTTGETVYKLNNEGKFIAQDDPHSLDIDTYNIGINWDDKGNFLKVWVPDEQSKEDVEKIALYYDRETLSGTDPHVKDDNKIWVKIYLKDEDWETPYVDSRVKIRPKHKKK